MPAPSPFPPPRFSPTSDRSPFLSDDVEVRIAEKVYEKPGWLVGKRTYIGLAIAALGVVGKLFHFDVPEDEINNTLNVVEANWDAIAEVVGAAGVLIAAIGARLKTTRHEKEVAVVKAVAKDLIVEADTAKAATVVVEKKLEVVAEVLTPTQVAEVKAKAPSQALEWGQPNTRTAGMVRSLPDGSWRSPSPNETAP